MKIDRKDFNRYVATDATLEEVGAFLGSAMGAALGQVGRDRAWLLVELIWGNMIKGVEEQFGIDLDTFKGTGAR